MIRPARYTRIRFVNLLCTASMRLISFSVFGDHTGLLYYNIGLTYVIKALTSKLRSAWTLQPQHDGVSCRIEGWQNECCVCRPRSQSRQWLSLHSCPRRRSVARPDIMDSAAGPTAHRRTLLETLLRTCCVRCRLHWAGRVAWPPNSPDVPSPKIIEFHCCI